MKTIKEVPIIVYDKDGVELFNVYENDNIVSIKDYLHKGYIDVHLNNGRFRRIFKDSISYIEYETYDLKDNEVPF